MPDKPSDWLNFATDGARQTILWWHALGLRMEIRYADETGPNFFTTQLNSTWANYLKHGKSNNYHVWEARLAPPT